MAVGAEVVDEGADMLGALDSAEEFHDVDLGTLVRSPGTLESVWIQKAVWRPLAGANFIRAATMPCVNRNDRRVDNWDW